MAEPATSTRSFFACYLLCSQNPRFKGRTYIGFTVNPKRRIRQHNGEITSGAWKTKRMRPWEMVLCLYGFTSNVHALQFEWAWQNPLKSLAVKGAASSLKSLGSTIGKVRILYTMLNLPEWRNLDLTINFLSTKHMPLMKGCPDLPTQMQIKIGPLEDLPCYNCLYSGPSAFDDDDSEIAEEDDGYSSGDGNSKDHDIVFSSKHEQNIHELGDVSRDDGCYGWKTADVRQPFREISNVAPSKRENHEKKLDDKKSQGTSLPEPKKRGRPKKITNKEQAKGECSTNVICMLSKSINSLPHEPKRPRKKKSIKETMGKEQSAAYTSSLFVQRSSLSMQDCDMTPRISLQKIFVSETEEHQVQLPNISDGQYHNLRTSERLSPSLCSFFSWEREHIDSDNLLIESAPEESQGGNTSTACQVSLRGFSTPYCIPSSQHEENVTKTTEKDIINSAWDITQFSPLWSPSPCRTFSGACKSPCVSQLKLGDGFPDASLSEFSMHTSWSQPFPARRQGSDLKQQLSPSPAICCSIISIASTPENGQVQIIDLTDSPTS